MLITILHELYLNRKIVEALKLKGIADSSGFDKSAIPFQNNNFLSIS